jgi:hypothetical protein
MANDDSRTTKNPIKNAFKKYKIFVVVVVVVPAAIVVVVVVDDECEDWLKNDDDGVDVGT